MSNRQIEIFRSKGGSTKIEDQAEKETVWMNQHQVSELFSTDRISIGRHISTIFKPNKLDENAKIAEVREARKRKVNRQINSIKNAQENGDLFGNEKDSSFRSSIGTIYQTFKGEDLYLSVEEKAANLLCFIKKKRSFSDGNKRIAAFLFLYFLEKNGILFDSEGNKRIADNSLVALTLMIAFSLHKKNETVAKVIVNLINRND